jgi:hypothetical protein
MHLRKIVERERGEGREVERDKDGEREEGWGREKERKSGRERERESLLEVNTKMTS